MGSYYSYRFVREKTMLRACASLGGGFLIAAIAIAAADIPARYAGAFPNSGRVSNITGVFTGATLALRYTVIRGTTFSPTTANYRCSRTAPNKTYCRGTFQTDDGRYGGRSDVTVTWSNGRPIRLAFGKC